MWAESKTIGRAQQIITVIRRFANGFVKRQRWGIDWRGDRTPDPLGLIPEMERLLEAEAGRTPFPVGA